MRYQRLRHGRWSAAEGLVYEGYDPKIHNRTIADPPAQWRRFWCVDFGYTNPFVLQCWAEDSDGRLYLYRELYRTQRLVEDHARDILKIVRRAACDQCEGKGPEDRACLSRHEWLEPRPEAIICDHDAEDRATLERHLGMTTTAAHKSVSDGVQAVQARLKVAPDGRPRIYFHPAALHHRDQSLVDAAKPCSTLEEIPGYVWERPREGSAAAERSTKEHPVKSNDHGCDTTRYMVAFKDLQGVPRMRGWI